MTQMSQQGHSLFECILYRATNGCEESITTQKKKQLVIHSYFHTIKN